MAFIGEGRISDGYVTLPEGVHDLLGFLRLHPNIVHPLDDQ
jgi:hypothetical protein